MDHPVRVTRRDGEVLALMSESADQAQLVIRSNIERRGKGVQMFSSRPPTRYAGSSPEVEFVRRAEHACGITHREILGLYDVIISTRRTDAVVDATSCKMGNCATN